MDNMRTVLTAERLWDGAKVINSPIVVVEDGQIASVSSSAETQIPHGERIDFTGLTLGPAFFDVHIHGSAGHDVMEATPESLNAIGGFLAPRGVGAYLATTVTAPIDATLKSLNGLAKLIDTEPTDKTAWPIGIHLEGPFLSHAKRGVHPPDLLLDPEIATFDKMWEAAEGKIRLLTLAPELKGAPEFAAHATKLGVRVSVGHSNATAAETKAVLDAGATSATHTFNAMRPLDHREPGILGTVLTRDDLFAELICDGIHTAPELVRLWWKAKGLNRAILITDAMAAAGMPDGDYMLGGFPVQVAGGKAMANGVLAGSVLTLEHALKNFVTFTGAPVENGLQLLGANPAAMTGYSDRAGSIAVGQAANLVAVDATGKLVHSIHAGALL